MLNDQDFHIPLEKKATLVSIVSDRMQGHSNELETRRSLVELRELLRTLGVEAGDEHIQNKKSIDAATVLGSGKLKEIAAHAKAEDSEILVFDFELTASQMRNINKLSGLEVIDRCSIILEIFAKHAQTKEAKIQIEISRLQYLLPRLSKFWTHLGRQKGGVGVRGGEGEQQIELDRRIIGQKISSYKKQLKDIETSRDQQRKKRKNQAVTAALVGYTNAGKSSLMNKLCKVDILAEDKLFATLDSTYRMLNPDSRPPMILIDTVGFISNLPSHLIEGFKTTLDSALEADLLLLIADASDPNYENQMAVTQNVLEDLGVTEKETIIVFNKCDLISDPLKEKLISKKYPHSFLVSTKNDSQMKELKDRVIQYFLDQQKFIEVFIPYESGEAHSAVASKTNVLSRINHEKGIFYRLQVPDFIWNGLNLQRFRLSPDDPMAQEFAQR